MDQIEKDTLFKKITVEDSMRAHVTKLAAARIDGDLEHIRLTAAEDLCTDQLTYKFYPPTQKTMGVSSWMNAQGGPSDLRRL